MPRVCTVCAHARRAEIEAALAAGESILGTAERFAVGDDALRRHAKGHVAAKPAAEPRKRAPSTAERIAELRRTELQANANRGARTSPRKVAAASIEAEAVRLRIEGKGFREIASELGISVSTAFEAVDRVLVRTRAEADERAELARDLELERCDTIIAAFWQRAHDESAAVGEGPEGRAVYSPAQDKAAATLLRAMQRRASLLGLDVATGVNVTIVSSPAFQEVTRAVFEALEPFPEARDAVMDRLREAVKARRPKALPAAG